MKANARLKLRADLILLILPVIFSLSAGCRSSNDSSDEPVAVIASSFRLQVSGLDGFAQAAIWPDAPPPGSVPLVPHPGVTIQFIDNHTIEMQAGFVMTAGTIVTVEVSVRNITGGALPRAWLVVHSPSNAVSLDEQSISGYIGNGFYYYIGNLPDNVIKKLNIRFVLPTGSTTGFSAFLDLAIVHDRVVFESSQPTMPPEILSITPQGSDFARLTNTNGMVYPSHPRWSPDGGWVAFSAGESLEEQIYLARADGGGTQEITCIPTDEGFTLPGAFTRDGKGIYVRHYDPLIDDAGVFLFNIAEARENCASTADWTLLASNAPSQPILSPAGDRLLYFRRESITALPPVPDPDPVCGDWPNGSELSLQSINAYILPVDPVTGAPTGSEVFYWENSMLGDADATFSLDGTKLALNAGGCAEYQYYCDTVSVIWRWRCNLNLTPGIYLLDIPADLGNLPSTTYTYTGTGAGKYQFMAGTGRYDYDLSWSAEYDAMLFTHFENTRLQLWYLDPADPANTRTQLTNWEYYNYTGRFMPPP